MASFWISTLQISERYGPGEEKMDIFAPVAEIDLRRQKKIHAPERNTNRICWMFLPMTMTMEHSPLPQKLRYRLKMDGCKMTFPFEWSLFSGHSFISRGKTKRKQRHGERHSLPKPIRPSWSPNSIQKKNSTQVTSTSALARCYPKSHPMYPSNPWSLKSMVHNAMEFHQWSSEPSRLPPHGKMWKNFTTKWGSYMIVIDGVTWGRYKWLKTNWFSLFCVFFFSPLQSGVMGPYLLISSWRWDFFDCENWAKPEKGKVVSQPPFFRGALLVSGRLLGGHSRPNRPTIGKGQVIYDVWTIRQQENGYENTLNQI